MTTRIVNDPITLGAGKPALFFQTAKRGEAIMTPQQYQKEHELVAQILNLEKNIEYLQNLRMNKIRELAVAVRNNSAMDRDEKDMNIPWLDQDIAELNLLAMEN